MSNDLLPLAGSVQTLQPSPIVEWVKSHPGTVAAGAAVAVVLASAPRILQASLAYLEYRADMKRLDDEEERAIMSSRGVTREKARKIRLRLDRLQARHRGRGTTGPAR